MGKVGFELQPFAKQSGALDHSATLIADELG